MTQPDDELDGCAEALILADLRDWQQLAALQERFRALAAFPVLGDGPARAAAALDPLFAEVDDAQVKQVAESLVAMLEEMRRSAAPAGPAGGASQDPPSTSILADGEPMREFVQRHQGEQDELASLLAAAGRGDGDALQAFRRLLHTLKGDSGMLGVRDLADVCHAIEEAVSDPAAVPVDAVLKALDWIDQRLDRLAAKDPADDLPPVPVAQAWLRAGAMAARRRRSEANAEAAERGRSGAPAAPDAVHAVSDAGQDHQLLAANGPLPAEAAPEMVAEFAGEAHEHLERVEGILLHLDGPSRTEGLHAVFRAFHTIKGLSGFLHLHRERILAHAVEDLLDRLRENGALPPRPVIDLLFASVDLMKRMVGGLGTALSAGGMMAEAPELPELVAGLRREAAAAGGRVAAGAPLGEILVGTGIVSRPVIDAALAQQVHLTPDRRIGEILVDAGRITPSDLDFVLAIQRPPEREARPDTESQEPRSEALRAGGGPGGVPTTMRVDVERVDQLNDAIGELVIAQNMLSCSADLRQLGSRRVAVLLAQLDRVTRTIQDMSMRLRLVSIRPVFQRMIRLGRDAARKLAKEVEVEVEGDDQELDKSVVDRLGDPLLHLVRNAVDHGIEPDARARQGAGKPATGRIRLRAYRTANSFCVEVSDDGRGLDHARILAKAVQRGLVREHQQLAEDEIANLVFLPGFSTAEKITDVSGRGVGMDVVKRMVEEMRGQVSITSVRGGGTTVVIALPLTLAIIDGMLVGVGCEQYILPTLSVVTSTRPADDDLVSVCGRSRMLTFQGHQIPVVALRDIFRLPPDPDARPLVVVVEDGPRRIGLVVDQLLGRQQVVLKTMGAALPGIPGVGGATINGDGRVCLVLDVAGLMQIASGAHPMDSARSVPHNAHAPGRS